MTEDSSDVMRAIAVVLAASLLAAGCVTQPSGTARQSPATGEEGASWSSFALSDLAGRGNFSIGEFSGKTTLIAVVSVSCPSCIVQLQRQLREIRSLSDGQPGLVTVALDLDNGNGPGFMDVYGKGTGFSGYSARSPGQMTLALFHRFGPFAINPETEPVILVCPSDHAVLLPPGVKTAAVLNETMAREC